MAYRKWTKEEKIRIIKEADEQGVTETIRKHSIYAATLNGWKDKLLSGGEEALASRRHVIDPEIKRLKQENQALKEILAEKELVIRIKDELLKKSTHLKNVK